MNRCNLILATVVCVLVTACASPTSRTSSDPDDKTIVTGSRLPAKDRDSSASVKSIESKSDVGEMMQRGNATGIQPRGGGM